MRKLFASLFVVSLGAAVVLGTVYAWTASQTTPTQNATVGVAAFSIDYTPNSNLLGPDNDVPVVVGEGSILNNGNFPLTITLVTVAVNAVTGTCSTTDFTPSSNLTYAGPVGPAVNDGQYFAQIATNNGAPDTCQGQTVDYTVQVDAET